jgi:hypothetical protein
MKAEYSSEILISPYNTAVVPSRKPQCACKMMFALYYHSKDLEWGALLSREVPGSNLGLETGYSY